jgi:hypothetical protein
MLKQKEERDFIPPNTEEKVGLLRSKRRAGAWVDYDEAAARTETS